MKKEPIQSFFKTECGLSEYHLLKMRANKGIWNKLRLYWFVFFATLRDLFI